jgi:uncharacterized repeat protein (TIGR02543 family)
VSGTVNNSDFSSPANAVTLGGSVSITSDSGSFSVTLANDTNTEGSESFLSRLRSGSTAGTIVATSSTVTIGDTSITPSVPTGGTVTLTGNSTVGSTITAESLLSSWSGSPTGVSVAIYAAVGSTPTVSGDPVASNISGVSEGCTYDITASDVTAGRIFKAFAIATNSVGNSSTISSETITATPPTSYSVTYNANGGTGMPANTTHTGSYLIPSSSPTRSGFTFTQWSVTCNDTFIGTYFNGSSLSCGGSLVLTAQWTASSPSPTPEPTQYTVTWDANGGTVSPTSNTVNAGVSVTAPTPTRDGYTFANWRNPLSGADPTIISAGGSYTPTSNITFYAVWTASPTPPYFPFFPTFVPPYFPFFPTFVPGETPAPATTWYCAYTESENGNITNYQRIENSDLTVCSVSFAVSCAPTTYPAYPTLPC